MWIELLKVITWPIFIAFILYIFRKPLINLLTRANKISAAGASIELTDNKIQKQTEETEEDVPLNSLWLFNDAVKSNAIQVVSEESGANIITSPEKKYEALLNYSALLYIALHYEKIYHNIINSQLKLIQLLNSNTGVNSSQMAIYYENVKKTIPRLQNVDLNGFLDYLEKTNLIVFENNAWFITISGRDFLKYLIETSKPLEKAD